LYRWKTATDCGRVLSRSRRADAIKIGRYSLPLPRSNPCASRWAWHWSLWVVGFLPRLDFGWSRWAPCALHRHPIVGRWTRRTQHGGESVVTLVEEARPPPGGMAAERSELTWRNITQAHALPADKVLTDIADYVLDYKIEQRARVRDRAQLPDRHARLRLEALEYPPARSCSARSCRAWHPNGARCPARRISSIRCRRRSTSAR
jgi:hypothetical protein